MWERGKGLLGVGGGKCLLYVGGWKRSAECGNGENIFWVWDEGSVCCMWEDGRGLWERVFWVWEDGSVCCMWEDGRVWERG